MRGVENNMSGVPIFPTGIIKTYNSPTKFSEEFEPKNFSVKKYGGSNKWRSEKFNNVMLHKSLNGLHEWVKTCIDDYLTNELRMKYDEHFISESWLNVNLKGGSQPVHSHPNSIISGTYYIKADKGHPPLEFHRTRPSDTHPFISLSEQYTGQHPNTATSIAFPASFAFLRFFCKSLRSLYQRFKIPGITPSNSVVKIVPLALSIHG